MRDGSDRKWAVPVVDAAGRVGWQPPRFDTYLDALAALLDFPIRPAEATDDDDRDADDDRDDGRSKGRGRAIKQEKEPRPPRSGRACREGSRATGGAAGVDDRRLGRPPRPDVPRLVPGTLIATWRAHRPTFAPSGPDSLAAPDRQAASPVFRGCSTPPPRAWGCGVELLVGARGNRASRLVGEDAAKPRDEQHLDEGQRGSLTWMAERLPKSGVVLAMRSESARPASRAPWFTQLLEVGGRAAAVVPHGLMHQWTGESRKLRANSPTEGLDDVHGFLREVSPNASWKDFSPRPDESGMVAHLLTGSVAPLVRSNSYGLAQRCPRSSSFILRRVPIAKTDARGSASCNARSNARASWWGWNGMARIAARSPRAFVDGMRPARADGSATAAQRIELEQRRAPRAVPGQCRRRAPADRGAVGALARRVRPARHRRSAQKPADGRWTVDDAAMGAASGTVLARLVDALLKAART